MLLIYTPENEDRQEFVFRPGELMSPEAEAIEDVGGTTWDSFEEYGRRFLAGNIKARRAALWIMLRRQNPRLRFSDVIVRVDQLDVDLEDVERDRIRAQVDASDMSDEEREEALALLDEDATQVTIDHSEVLADVPMGKSDPGDGDTDST